MSDYISRQAAIEAVDNLSKNYAAIGQREWHPHVDAVLHELGRIPAADVRENVRGEWLDDGIDYIDIGMEYRRYECNHCGYMFVKCRLQEYPHFCQCCGADMRRRE